MDKIKIETVATGEDEGKITFTDGSMIFDTFCQECCEVNYADFSQLEEAAYNAEFTPPLTIEKAEHGFRFGNPGNMWFVPCYSIQSGFYSYLVFIHYVDIDGNIIQDGIVIDCDE